MNEYIAHIGINGDTQSVKEHSEATAMLARDYSIEPFKGICYNLGLYHDIGKYQSDFQRRIGGEHSVRVEHSICGAKELISSDKNPLSYLMAFCVAGHHGGIPDGGTGGDSSELPTLAGRLKRDCGDYGAFRNELTFEKVAPQPFLQLLAADSTSGRDPVILEKYAFFTRYCYSCLVEADTVDTICATGETVPEKVSSDFPACLQKLDLRLGSFFASTNLQKTRATLQRQAFDNIKNDAEIYLMNMPTGSGKTFASMKCALERVIKGKKKRIIYVIPYNSIIDQTVDEFEKLFGESAQILRHQSSFSFEEEETDEDYITMLKFASENWNAEIIITTAVQFFESVYSNRRQKLRKFHNIADSVIVFDEAHLMPENYLQPCLRAIAFAVKYLSSEVLLLTATMPDYEELMEKYALHGLKICELIPDKTAFPVFEKCIFTDIGERSDEQIALLTDDYPTSLVVVNSRNAARKIFGLVSGERYHLSTYMTGIDRAKTIAKIKERVKQLSADFPDGRNIPEDRKIKVVSTSLIEAGVDLDFFAVFRELAGLDSIIQAGGRCNREGSRNCGDVKIFVRSDGRRTNTPRESITADIIKKYDNIVSSAAIREYYSRLYHLDSDKIISNSISNDCNRLNAIPFKTYADNFRIIDSRAISIVIPQGEGEELRRVAEATGFASSRKVQKYCCSVYDSEFSDLMKQGVLNDYHSGIYFLTDLDYYDKDIGIIFQGKDIFV